MKTKLSRALILAPASVAAITVAAPAFAADSSISAMGAAIDFTDMKTVVGTAIVALIGVGLLLFAGSKLASIAGGKKG
ncbi:hypothetical protein [Sphingomonas oryzagri]